MGWKSVCRFARARAFSVLVSCAVTSCGGTDPSRINGYWAVSNVRTQSLGSSQRQAEWRVPEAEAYVLAFQGNQMSIPSHGSGLAGFQLPPQGAHYEMQDDRILLNGNGTNPLQIVDISDDSMTLSQATNDAQSGNMTVQHQFRKLDPVDVRNWMQARNEQIPPELQNSGYSQGPTPKVQGGGAPPGEGVPMTVPQPPDDTGLVPHDALYAPVPEGTPSAQGKQRQ